MVEVGLVEVGLGLVEPVEGLRLIGPVKGGLGLVGPVEVGPVEIGPGPV
jgi:hypothetical protein